MCGLERSKSESKLKRIVMRSLVGFEWLTGRRVTRIVNREIDLQQPYSRRVLNGRGVSFDVCVPLHRAGQKGNLAGGRRGEQEFRCYRPFRKVDGVKRRIIWVTPNLPDNKT